MSGTKRSNVSISADIVNVERNGQLPKKAKLVTVPMPDDEVVGSPTASPKLYNENACTSPDASDTASLASEQSGLSDPSLASKTTETPFVWPADWPAVDGEIDLDTHDLPHASAATEWWYVNSHLTTDTGKDVSLFASFFRRAHATKQTDGGYEHALNWAIVDAEKERYYHDPLVDSVAPQTLKTQLEDETIGCDHRIRTAFLEIVNKGNVPLPDRMFTGDVDVSHEKLNLQFAKQKFWKDTATGHYRVQCVNEAKGMACDLTFEPKRKPIRQGNNGVVKVGLSRDTMFYYYIPRNTVTGTVTIEGTVHNVTGNGWYDHEFGGDKASVYAPKKKEADKTDDEKDYAWNWTSVQLENGTDITATLLVQPATMTVEMEYAVVTTAAGGRDEYKNITFKPTNEWTSCKTTQMYPTEWVLDIPDAGLSMTLSAQFANQEFMTLIAKPSFWEGRMVVTANHNGKMVKGLGFLERYGFDTMGSLDKFFKKMSKQVQQCIHSILPHKPTFDDTCRLLADDDNKHYMDGVDLDVMEHTIINPIREIVDRGGKAWRSYAFLLCIDAVGGDSHNYRHWLAMPEIMHVGSLIVDDIQDKSEQRRGGPCAHKLFGDALAINSGTAAYFISLDVLQKMTPDLSDAMRLRIYDMYFLTLRAGHCGQAFDINGLDYMMKEVVEKGEGLKLEERVVCTHRLKSAVPAGNLARMGAIIGGGSEEQIQLIGKYFEQIGIAFQIIDDVLNLRGLPGKTRGEDLMCGKITHPVAKAMSRLDKPGRVALWEALQAKPQERAVVDGLIDTIEQCGALQASADEAKERVMAAWKPLDEAMPDSFYKMLMRSFGLFVLERYY